MKIGRLPRDNEHAEQARPHTSLVASHHRAQPFGASQQAIQPALIDAESAQAVFDDDHGAVDDQTEIERTQTHEIAADRLPTMPLIVNNIDNGITNAVISAARKLPSNANNTAITSTAPSNRFFLHGLDGFVHQRGAIVNGLQSRRRVASD